jgi:hypothetical protein
MAPRPPLPPFTLESAILKVRLAEDAWNTRDTERVSLAYSIDSRWRNRSEFISGQNEIVAFLTRKWTRNWSTGSSRSYGRITKTASRCDSHMNIMTILRTTLSEGLVFLLSAVPPIQTGSPQ